MVPSPSHPPRPDNNEPAKDIEQRVRAAKQRRVELTTGQRDLARHIAELLFADDPLRIASGSNTAEYTAEAESIVIELPAAADVRDATTITHRVFVHWFSAEDAGPPERYESVAAGVWDAWTRYRNGSAHPS